MIIFEVAKRSVALLRGGRAQGMFMAAGRAAGRADMLQPVNREGGEEAWQVGRYLRARRRKGREDPWLPKKKRGRAWPCVAMGAKVLPVRGVCGRV